MIMNKKIFTLLISILLAFSGVSSLSAADAEVTHGLWSKAGLGVGEQVKDLVNNRFYHLRVDSIRYVNSDGKTWGAIGTAEGNANRLNDSIVLFLGETKQNKKVLYLAPLSRSGVLYSDAYANITDGKDSKAAASASSLWCTRADWNGYDATYQFTNKLHGDLLNLNLDGFQSNPLAYGWSRVNNRTTTDGNQSILHQYPLQLEGGWSYDWGFSPNFAAGSLQSHRPLYLPVETKGDSVAVLVLTLGSGSYDDLKKTGGWQAPTTGTYTNKYQLGIKIASFRDVEKGEVEGLLYFTLYDAQPFVVSAKDFKAGLGLKKSNTNLALSFGDGTPFQENPLASATLTAEHINSRPTVEGGFFIRPTGYQDGSPTPIDLRTAVPGAERYVDTITYSPAHLDSLGYLFLTDGTNTNKRYIRVAYEYHTSEGDDYLKLEKAASPFPSTSTALLRDRQSDSLRYGQYAFRLVYHPTDDNIEINAFQAAYAPKSGSSIIDSWNLGKLTQDGRFQDSLVQARLTYVADTAALLEKPTGADPARSTWDKFTETSDSLAYLITPLRPGYNPRFSEDAMFPTYNYYQRLYITGQGLGGSNNTVLTLGSEPATRIYFPGYYDCTSGGPGVQGRTSIESDLYLIRNANNEYLNVPLYTSNDSAVWSALEPGVDPTYIPSFHWVIKKTVPVGSSLSSISPVTITNREFNYLEYKNAQLTEGQSSISGLSANWNNAAYGINEKAGIWAGPAGSYSASFLRITDAEARTNETLGYRYIPVSDLLYSNFQFEFKQSFGSESRYLGKRDSMVTTVNNLSSAAIFTLDTIIQDDRSSSLKPYGYGASRFGKSSTADDVVPIAILRRQLYKVEVSPAGSYAVGPQKTNRLAFNQNNVYYAIPGNHAAAYGSLGKPVYYLRDVQTNTNGSRNFALVQVIDTLDVLHNQDKNLAPNVRTYLNSKYGSLQVETFINRLSWSNPASKTGLLNNPGLFVASVDPNTGDLVALFRANANGTPSTFQFASSSSRVYRRLNTPAEGVTDKVDRPVTVRIHSATYDNLSLFENTGQAVPVYEAQRPYWKEGFNYLGELNLTLNGSALDSANTTLYIDTAYINRPGGDVKPQYLIAVNPQIINKTVVCDAGGEPRDTISGFTIARYLINAVDSAKLGTSARNLDYIWAGDRVRLVFINGVHANDSLYLLGNNPPFALPESDEDNNPIGIYSGVPSEYIRDSVYRKNADGALFLDISKLSRLGVKGLPLNNNRHKPYVFSFRLPYPESPDFLIESLPYGYGNSQVEVTVAPIAGSWVSNLNGVPAVTPPTSTLGSAITEGAVFELSRRSSSSGPVTSLAPVATSSVKVISGVGSVSIQGAAGRRVTVTNVLGQSVISKVISSDAETLSLPRGIVLVTVDGVSSVKAIVK
jgi:hypothetical protein